MEEAVVEESETEDEGLEERVMNLVDSIVEGWRYKEKRPKAFELYTSLLGKVLKRNSGAERKSLLDVLIHAAATTNTHPKCDEIERWKSLLCFKTGPGDKLSPGDYSPWIRNPCARRPRMEYQPRCMSPPPSPTPPLV
jgi:hypothetical protein